MIVFADNDILIKLAGCDLLIPFCEAIGTQNTDFFVTSSAKFAIPKQSKKKLKTPEAIQQLHEFMGRTSAIQDVQPQMDILDTLTETPDIDGGEAFLILSAYNNPTCRLATGDKRCLASLLATPSLSELVSSLSGRVYTLETALLILISRLDFDVVNHKVVRRCVDDGLLNLAFGEHRNEDHAIACLSSYSSNLKDLVAESHLIRY
ncbi:MULTISPECIES: hypothetical protein [unclassified Acinetobacter]|uniref:hypothetical protein n=1 Tax=unclassified Acinetobacter TaxID=196816 RepID=UPI0024489F55|nr:MULTISPECIES: hypothetical protein [unclassified Acinetobacter]MDH0030686.1 hypothetical protein [Acinetobacter sp. GD04021]MDH0886204.1 hypothetical protein [Acinetobacter sp. GD03873]MDH1081822.1 hypothetical protein [Acinetobacter sp. GD03983]MDH2189681.1 hypothetical protein [Acinetobacter sp. GD03645]MDH2202673.1 hypothetical protein [Acinetobacter sp. GD03647]